MTQIYYFFAGSIAGSVNFSVSCDARVSAAETQ